MFLRKLSMPAPWPFARSWKKPVISRWYIFNRFRIVIGGTVSTGNAAQKDDMFIDNIAIEYRLDNSGTRYVKLFHETNYESVLEGEVIETGLGVVLRKKVSKLGELFIFKKKKDEDEE